jgi:hypothetical protein
VLSKTQIAACLLMNALMAERGGLKPQVLCKPCFTREIAAISFTVASFQIARVKRREARRSPKKPKKWRKTVARTSPTESRIRPRQHLLGRAWQFRRSDQDLLGVFADDCFSGADAMPKLVGSHVAQGTRRLTWVSCSADGGSEQEFAGVCTRLDAR